jgi:hypothetical protein
MPFPHAGLLFNLVEQPTCRKTPQNAILRNPAAGRHHGPMRWVNFNAAKTSQQRLHRASQYFPQDAELSEIGIAPRTRFWHKRITIWVPVSPHRLRRGRRGKTCFRARATGLLFQN